jgi:hypothetical protein
MQQVNIEVRFQGDHTQWLFKDTHDMVLGVMEVSEKTGWDHQLHAFSEQDRDVCQRAYQAWDERQSWSDATVEV